MGKNNFDERLRKMEPRKDHYSIRKFSVGVASVLIGFSFLGLANSQTVRADKIEPQIQEAAKSATGGQKSGAQDAQKKTDESNVSADNSEVKQTLTGVQAAVAQAAKNRSLAAIARKDSKLVNVSESGKKLNDIGLTGRKNTQGTDTKSQNVKGQSEKNSASVDKNADSAKKTAVKSDSKSDQAVNEKSTDSKDNQSDTQTLTVKTSDIKSGKADQAEDLAKELDANLTTDNSGKLSLKGVDNKLASGTEQTLDVNKTAGQDTKNQKNQADAKKLARLYGNNLDEIKSKDVSDWAGLSEAMNDSSVGEIDFTKDISINGTTSGVRQPNPSVNSHKLQLTGKNIARTLIINGNGHCLNFGDYYLSFDENNQSNGTPWNLTIKNVTINANGYSSGTYAGAFSPFYMGKDDFGGDNLWNKKSYLAKNKVTFDNVTADIKNGAFYTTTMAHEFDDEPYTTVTFEGKNDITCEGVNADSSQVNNYSSAVSASHIIFANGTTNFYVSTKKTNNHDNAGGNILRAKVEDGKDKEAPIVIDEGTTVNFNVPTKDVSVNDIHATDVRGILVNNALEGTVVVNGTLNANMQRGHSTAIWAGNLEIGKNGTVNIQTKQDNQAEGTENDWGHGVYNYNSVHFAPISLGVGFAANVTASASHLTDDGTLIIKRDNTGKTLTPLIAFGSGGVNPVKYNMTVGDGATLDLQDNSTTFDSVLSGTKQPNTPPAGMITMFGTSSKDSFTLDNPGYVNFQRYNQSSPLRGNFIRLEGTTNATWLNGPSTSNAVTPIAQWDAGDFDSPSFIWYVKQLHTQNQWGNYANSYTSKKNPTANKGVDTILDATDNSFIMGTNQAGKGSTSVTNGEVNTTGDTGVGYKTDYVNQFGNHFSWWLPQRLAMGSKLEQHGIVVNDADKYQPEVKTINTDTSHKLSSLNVKDGITDLIGPDGKIPYDGKIDWTKTHWYNATEDGTNWTKIMGKDTKGPKPVAASVNTDGTLKEGTTSNTATVVYTDGSIDFVNIPIDVKAAKILNIEFVDDDNKESQVGNTVKETGAAGQTIDNLNLTVPDHYVLAEGQVLPKSYTFTDQDNQSLEIHLKHKIDKGISKDQNPSDSQTSTDDFSKTVKRTITAKEPQADGTIKDVDLSQSVTLTRTGDYDEALKKIVKWGAWTTSHFDAVNAPVVAGYKPNPASVDAVTSVGADYNDPNISITYSANDQSEVIKFWDDTENKEIGNDHTLSGKTNQTIDINLTAPAGYDLVSGNTVPTKYTFKASGNDPITVHFTHHIDKDITKTPTGGAKDSTGKDVKDTDFSETVTRTIKAEEPQADGTTKEVDLSQHVTLKRTGDYDEVTKIITWHPWSKSSFDAVNAPTVAGYTPNEEVVPAVDIVTDGYKDPNVKITYTAGSHKMVYTFVDDDEKEATVGSPITINGDTNQTVNTGLIIPDGYKLATGTDSATDIYDLPASYKFGSTDAAVKIHLDHKIDKGISKDQNPSDSQTSTDDFSKTVKRTITAKEPQADGTIKDVDLSQSVTLTRTGDYDEALKKIVKWGAWTTSHFDAVNAPNVDGYKPSQSSIAAATAKDGYVDPKIEINYTANASSFNIVYKDDKGNQVFTKKISGVTDGTVPSDSITDNIPAGWVTDGTVPTLPDKFVPQDKEKDITVKIKHGTRVVNPGDVPTPGTKVSGDNGNKTPGDGKPKNDITYDDLHKDITRTITVNIPEVTAPKVIKQTVSYQRKATIDDVTGEVEYGDWVVNPASTEKSLAEYDAPAKIGYTPTQSKVDAETPTSAQVANWTDPNIVINYMKGDQHISYQFVDDDKKDAAGNPTKVGSPITVSGKTNQTVNPSQVVKVPANYWLAKNQTIPTNVKLSTENTDLGKTVLIHLVHAIKVIEPNNPSVDPNNTKMFSTATRKIEVTAPGQTTPTDYLQSVRLERSEKVDAITNKVVGYGEWKVAKSETSIEELSLDSEPSPEFPEWAVPQYDGYTSYVDNEASTEVKAAPITFDQNGYPKDGAPVHVIYQKITNGGTPSGNDQPTPPTPQGQIIIKYVDPNGNTVHTVTVPVDKGSTIDPSGAIKGNVPKGYKLPDGYTAPTSASEGSTISVSIVPTDQKKPTPTPTPTPTPGRGDRKTHNNGGKSSHKGNSRNTNAPKHNAKSGSNSLPLGENVRLGTNNGRRQGGNLAPQGENNNNGQNGAQNAAQNASHNGKTLPQTGENSHKTAVLSTIGMLGLTAAGIVALLALGGDRKRR